MSIAEEGFVLQAESASTTAPNDLLEALKIADIWEVFYALPKTNQDEFAGWILNARDQAARWRRIDALVLALRLSPMLKA